MQKVLNESTLFLPSKLYESLNTVPHSIIIGIKLMEVKNDKETFRYCDLYADGF
jgi:hypothetical protein